MVNTDDLFYTETEALISLIYIKNTVIYITDILDNSAR